MPRPINATISLDALRHNLSVVRRHAPRASVFAVIKANAYGHGVMRAAHALVSAERYALLEGAFEPRDLVVAAEHGLAIAIHSQEQIRMLDSAPSDARFDVLLK